MSKKQKTWIRLILVMTSIMATFLGLQMFILVDLQKSQLTTTVLTETKQEIIPDDSGDVAGDMPPLTISTMEPDTVTPEPLPTISATATALPVEPTATAGDTAVASAPIVTIIQNEVEVPVAQQIVPPVAVLDNLGIVAAQGSSIQNTGTYADGMFMGDAVQTDRWGTTQVSAVIENGELVDVEVVQYPNHTDRSAQISLGALPTLISEAIQNQSADVDIVSRATDTSRAFIASLDSALSDALS